MMSICPEPDVCSLYIDGELSTDEKVNFEQHMKVCSKCKDSLDSFQKLKKYMSCDDIPELDLKQSFKKLTLRKSFKRFFILYKIFYSWKKNKVLFSVSLPLSLFGLLFVTAISIQNNMNIGDLDKSFKPIIPIAYESSLPMELDNLRLSNIHTHFRFDKKMNDRTYKNMLNTFNGFTNLYSNLEYGKESIYSNKISIMNRSGIVNYYTDIPFYRSLNRK